MSAKKQRWVVELEVISTDEDEDGRIELEDVTEEISRALREAMPFDVRITSARRGLSVVE